MFRIFPVVDYELVYYSFQLEGINDVKYKIIFAQEENVAENGEAATALMFNPVKVDGSWYLTVKKAGQKFDELIASLLHEYTLYVFMQMYLFRRESL